MVFYNSMCRLLCKPLCWVSTNIFENGFLSRMSGHVIRDIIHLIMQYVTLLYGWINEQKLRWRESCILIGYPSGPLLRISCVGPANKRSFFGHESLLTKLVRSRWLNVDVIPFSIYIDLDKNAKKNFANIQPSSPHAWSITHMSSNLNSIRDYLHTFERLCDTCSLDYFKFFCLCLSYFASFSCFHAFYFTPTFYTYSSMQNIFSSLMMQLISESWGY